MVQADQVLVHQELLLLEASMEGMEWVLLVLGDRQALEVLIQEFRKVGVENLTRTMMLIFMWDTCPAQLTMKDWRACLHLLVLWNTQRSLGTVSLVSLRAMGL